ncbi:Hsp20/alpha crystallin family protein [Paludibacterium denitrificans]|uniref:Hsp20 family protein n=1 Tax=Paludibacterium denitrificans TaxID=2675226 RepID=A0A844GF16_9NEIS|nr:Hsp20/alpha crystallin family protein [Paludibacterium denitrificans]MTD33304.1 Hsp20 family protein [Paludibacterium denitrificans]
MNELIRRSGLEPLFDDVFKGFFVRPLSLVGKDDLTSGIRLDVKEDDNAYTIHAELPGVKKEDIQVQVDGNRVSISAEVKRESEQKEGEKVLRSERYYGRVSRTFTLPVDIDESGATAKSNEGVLELVLPKKTQASTHKLTVE